MPLRILVVTLIEPRRFDAFDKSRRQQFLDI